VASCGGGANDLAHAVDANRGVRLRVLVAGGAGYIGSHTVVKLIEAGHDVVIADDFSNSKPAVRERLETITGRKITMHAVDLCDRDATDHLFTDEKIDAVIH
jgi:UDP-glucose 4-epimerase